MNGLFKKFAWLATFVLMAAGAIGLSRFIAGPDDCVEVPGLDGPDYIGDCGAAELSYVLLLGAIFLFAYLKYGRSGDDGDDESVD